MSDEFWRNLAGIIIAVTGFATLWFQQRNITRQNRQIAVELHQNTQATIQQGQQLDSAERKGAEDREEAVKAAKLASRAVIDNVVANKQVLKDTTAIKEQITQKLNGGPGGLAELQDRVARLETNLESSKELFLKAHAVVTKSIEDLAEAINRKQLI